MHSKEPGEEGTPLPLALPCRMAQRLLDGPSQGNGQEGSALGSAHMGERDQVRSHNPEGECSRVSRASDEH